MAPQTRSSTARLSRAHSLQTSQIDDSVKTTTTTTTSCHQPSEALETLETLEIPETSGDSEDLQDPQDPQDLEDTSAPGKPSHNNLRLDLQPITNSHQAFKDLLSKRLPEIIAIANKGGFQLRVATICSGTEAPIFALKLIKEISQLLAIGQTFLQFDHLFSVEIEPFKQAYISRNAPNSIVFRDVVDLADPEATAAPTILGDHREIPREIDLLVAGTSCVDFSSLNSNKKNSVQLMATGARLVEEWTNSDQNPEKKKIAKNKPADNKTARNKSNVKKSAKKPAKKKSDEEKPPPPLREGYYDEVRQWLNSITPAEIQTTGDTIGQSSITFLSTVCYINQHRPKMAVLENVIGAPWSAMCGLFLRAADYAATYTFLDTKDYYIPHTRKRGYVIALDREVFGESADHILREWKTQLASMKRGASAPVQDWLLSSQDPLTMRARQDESEKAITSGLNSSKDSQWERSKLRHGRVRRQFKLGNSRRMTAWGRGGIEKPYDRIDRLIIKGQNNRALDCVDIYYLRCLHAESQPATDSTRARKTPTGPMQYDIKFKSQIFDLSQNIDRGQITRNFGFTGCLTPRGMNLITDQGRLASGFEALNLQGLPLRDLELSRETQDELRDLAGNAMTTTVVGAVMFSLLIAICIHSSKAKSPPLSPIIVKEHNIIPYQPLYQPLFMKCAPEETWSSTLEPFHDAQEVIDISKRCRRYCYCNGGAKYSTEELVRCQVCNITRCTSCAGNPNHQFGSPLSIKNPIMNDNASQEIMKYFPAVLKDVVSEAIDHIPFRPGLQNAEVQRTLLLSLQTITFYYTQVLLSENVAICYSAKDSNWSFQLQAVVSDRWVTWYLFLDPWSHCGKQLSESLGLSAAQMLRPFGRLRVYSQAPGFLPTQDAWEFWVFTEISFNVNITKPHPGSIEIDGIPLANLPAETHEELRSIAGIYQHHPECDAAEDSLHANVQGPKRYLFKDPTRIGPTQDDCYIISDECRFLEKHEFRDFCVKFLPNWTPKAAETRATASIRGYWASAKINSTRSQVLSESTIVRCMRHAGLRSIPGRAELQSNDVGQRVRTLASVRLDSNMLADVYITLLKYEQADPKDWAIVSRSDYSALFDILASVNVNLDDIETEIPLITTGSCNLTYPSLPEVYWMEKNTGGTSGAIREPYRLSSEMRVYEERLQRWCEPLQVAVNIKNSENKEGWKTVTANYEVNVDLLVHVALSHFPKSNDGSRGVPEVKTRVKIEKGSLYIPNLRFESFRKSLKRLPGSNSQDSIEPSRLFTEGHALTKQQEISLNWMLDRELNPAPFAEREIEECRSDPLSLRVLGVAERQISRPGGILADDVGYGKTVVSLALMAAQQNFDQNESLQKRSNQEDTTALAASLALVPRHLVNQWCDEAAKFLGWKGTDVLVIKSSRSLLGALSRTESDSVDPPPPKRPRTTKKSITLLAKLKAAKLIIVSTAIFDDKYYTWLGKYAGSLAHPLAIPRTKSTRDTTNPNVLGAFQDWYEDATTYARRHISGFDPAIFHQGRLEAIDRRQKSLQDSWMNVVADHYDISTRLGLQIVRGDKTGKSTKDNDEAATVRKEYSDIARANHLTEEDFRANNFMHVLEAFSFARVIYDEFSYENACASQFIKKANAYAKWVLSATPPTSNVKAVCDIGELLGIHVARAVKLRPGLPLITEGPIVLRQNTAEKQLSYGKLFTDHSVYERVEQGHKFIRHFASANPFDEEGLGKIEVSETAHCSYMTRHQLIMYLDIVQDFRTNLEISNLLKRHNIDSDIMIEFPSEGRLYAGLALAYVASVDCKDDDNDIDKLLLHRREKLKEAQQKLKDITEVAIWLVRRRSEEEVEKKNDSATSTVEDLAWHFGSILDADAETFGGTEALEAITDATFTKEQFEVFSTWLKDVDENERNSEAFFKDFFTLLDEQMKPSAWATYFRLSVDRIASLEDSEVADRIQELGDHNAGSLTPIQARQHLRELVVSKQSPVDSQAQDSENGRKKITKRKGRTRPNNQSNTSDEGVEDKNKPQYPRFDVRLKIRGGNFTETESELTNIMLKVAEAKEDVLTRAKQVTTAINLLCPDEARECSACGHSCDDMRFLPECGHFICSRHLGVKFCGQIKSEKFPNGSGCSSLVPQRSIPVKQVDRCPIDTKGKLLKVNPKSTTICRKIREILDHSDDSILVFYQFDRQKREICYLLERDGIVFDDRSRIETEATIANQTEASQRVRILKLNSEEAAGSNFQDANHVLFVSTPIFGRQEDFEKYVKQAKGRAVRHGQLKRVQVYYFITVNTFEVDLLQLRKKSHIRLEKDDVARFAPWSGDAHDSEGDVNMTDAADASS